MQTTSRTPYLRRVGRGRCLLGVLCQLLANREAPVAVAPHLAGARLHVLPKKSGGVRPIAVGKTLRRLVSKVL